MSTGKEIGFNFCKLLVASGDKGLPGGTRTNFKINMGVPVQKIKRISMVSVTFPNNAYNVNGSGGGENNDFEIIIGATVYEFVVAPGFYTTSSLTAAMQSAIQAELTTLALGQTFTLTQDPLSQLVSATYNAGAGAASIQISDTSTGSGAWELLGFDTSTPITLNNGVPVVATNLPSLGGLKEVYIQSSTLAPGHMFDSDQQRNVLQVIPITAPFGVSNVWDCKVDALCELTYMGKRTLSIIDFTLTDRYGNIIDLHGGNLIINLKIWFDQF